MNDKHKGPHCDGLCEGAAYTIKIRQLEQELATWRNGATIAVARKENQRLRDALVDIAYANYPAASDKAKRALEDSDE